MFPTRLKFERLHRGWTQSDVARLAGNVGQQEVSLIEQGRLIPRPEQLDRLARAFGVGRELLLKRVAVAVVDAEHQSLEQHA